jgi:hypothetical protein
MALKILMSAINFKATTPNKIYFTGFLNLKLKDRRARLEVESGKVVSRLPSGRVYNSFVFIVY